MNDQVVEVKIKQVLNSINLSLQTGNWLSALALTLTMPDICGKLENPNYGSIKRYKLWVDKYFIYKYTSRIEIEGKFHQHLLSEDLYALRCSYLHSGEAEFSKERIRKALNYVQFSIPVNGQGMHLNTIRDQLQLRVDIFCVDMIYSVLDWLNEVKDDNSINERAGNLLSFSAANMPFEYRNF